MNFHSVCQAWLMVGFIFLNVRFDIYLPWEFLVRAKLEFVPFGLVAAEKH
jgi:hypothetical protein